MAVYNGLPWLPEQVASIRAQRAVSVDFCVHDDGSTDGSRDWIRCNLPDARLLPEHQRFGAAAQSFLHLCREADLRGVEYVALSDQDDIWLDDKLERAITQLERHGAAGYSSNVEAFWPDGRTALVDKAQPQQVWDYLFEAAGPGCTYVVPVSVARDFQQWLRQHEAQTARLRFHDWLLYAWVRSRGGAWWIDPTPSLRYRQHAANEVGVNQGWRATLKRARHLLGGFALDQVVGIAQCLTPRDQRQVEQLLCQGRKGLFELACHSSLYRRRRRDQIALGAFACLQMLRRQSQGQPPAHR